VSAESRLAHFWSERSAVTLRHSFDACIHCPANGIVEAIQSLGSGEQQSNFRVLVQGVLVTVGVDMLDVVLVTLVISRVKGFGLGRGKFRGKTSKEKFGIKSTKIV
jgi:hypothetical protein